LFLQPLGLTRQDAWLCDLVPHSCKNKEQAKALRRDYDPLVEKLGLPMYDWPELPSQLADDKRRGEIEAELFESQADVVITLGDQPLKWFTSHFGTHAALSNYGKTLEDYGRLHGFQVSGRDIRLLPLVHPRQAARLGSHSSGWAELHEQWVSIRQ
jgi:uracil-DNA glycosylase